MVHSIKRLTDYGITPDGKRIVLNFEDARDGQVSLEFDALSLDKLFFELGLATNKARQLSGLAEHGIVPFLRPDQFRADVVERGQTVVVSFGLANGLEMHFGLEPEQAQRLAEQIEDAAGQGLRVAPEKPN